MLVRFNIAEAREAELDYGFHCIYILGGHHIEANPDFYISVRDLKTGEEIELTEKSLKARDYKLGKKAIKFYDFQTNSYGKFRISAHNFRDIVVRDSILEAFPFPFSLPLQLISFIKRKSQKPKSLEQIEIFID